MRQKSRQRQPASESASNTDSETEVTDIVIPPSASVKYVPGRKGAPGLQINTNKTRQWVPVVTPVASRTRSKFKTVSPSTAM